MDRSSLPTDRGRRWAEDRVLRADDLRPIAAHYFDAGGVQLCHRVRVELGGHDVTGEGVDWNAVTGSVDELVEALGQYRDLGVSDLSIIPGQDDETSHRTVEALVADVIPQLG